MAFENSLKAAFRPIMILAKLFGIFYQERDNTGPKRGKCRAFVSKCCLGNHEFAYCCSLLAIIYASLVRSLALAVTDSFSFRLRLPVGCMLAWAFAVTVSITISLIKLPKLLPLFVENAAKLELEDINCNPSSKRTGTARKIKYICIILIIVMVTLSVFPLLTPLLIDDETIDRLGMLYPANASSSLRFIVIIFNTVAFVVNCGSMLTLLALYWSCCDLLNSGLRGLRQKIDGIKASLDPPPNTDIPSSMSSHQLEECLVDLLSKHTHMVSCVSQIDGIFRHILGLAYGVFIPIFCVILYALSQGVTAEYYWLTIGEVVYMFSAVAVLSISAAAIYDKSWSLYDVLMTVDVNHFSDKALHLLSVFTARFSGNGIGLTASGVFIVNRSALLTMVGTVITYGVIVFQFNPGDTCPVPDCAGHNTSDNSSFLST